MGEETMSISRMRIPSVLVALGIILSTVLFSVTAPPDDDGAGRRVGVSAAPESMSGTRPGEEGIASGDSFSQRLTMITRSGESIASSAFRPTRMAATPAPVRCDKRCRNELATARTATEQFWDVRAALAAGFVELPGCASTVGAEGIEYVHPGRADDDHVDLRQPESLLYVPEGISVGRRLVAVQYSVPVREGQPRPELFGRIFDGPFPSRASGMALYRLRAWLFSTNPDGMFAHANVTEACSAATLVASDGALEKCIEVNAHVSVSVDAVRRAGRIPEEFQIEGQDDTQKGGGTTPLFVGAFQCRQTTLKDDVVANNLVFSEVAAHLEAPDWEGVDGLRSDWPIRFFMDNRAIADSWREHTGADPDVFIYSPDVELAVTPTTAKTNRFAFRSPEFDMLGDVPETSPAGVPVLAGFWRQGSAGVGRIQFWIDEANFVAAVVEVVPRRGGLLAELVGCDAEADSCEPIPGGIAATFDRGPFRTYIERNFWNPRHDGPA